MHSTNPSSDIPAIALPPKLLAFGVALRGGKLLLCLNWDLWNAWDVWEKLELPPKHPMHSTNPSSDVPVIAFALKLLALGVALRGGKLLLRREHLISGNRQHLSVGHRIHIHQLNLRLEWREAA